MKKSDKYYYAILAVLHSEFPDDIKLHVLELLLDARGTAMFTESREEAKV